MLASIGKFNERVVRWFPQLKIAALVAIGFVMGMLVRLPFFPWELPDSAAQILGSMATAFIAVMGAAVVTDASVHRERRAARDIVLNVIGPVMNALELTCTSGASKGPSGKNREEFPGACRDLVHHMHEASERLELLGRSLHGLGPAEVIAIADARGYVFQIFEFEQRLIDFSLLDACQISPEWEATTSKSLNYILENLREAYMRAAGIRLGPQPPRRA